MSSRVVARTWASYQIRQIAGCACAGTAGNVLPATDIKGNHQLAIPACITARASRTCRDACWDRWPKVAGKTFPAFPAHAQPAILPIWQEPIVNHAVHMMTPRHWHASHITGLIPITKGQLCRTLMYALLWVWTAWWTYIWVDDDPWCHHTHVILL